MGGTCRMSPVNCRQHAENIAFADVDRSSRDHRAVGIAGIGGHPEADDRFVGLVGIEQIGRELGRLTEAQVASRPVASGSRVPVCPPLAAENRRRTFCRASLEVSPSGLSSKRTPSTCFQVFLTCMRIGLFFRRLVAQRVGLSISSERLAPRSIELS
jgi:hypothetical protein